jgi:hypothetical protein
MTEPYIAWWNVKNLFDKKDAPPDRRPEAIKRKIIADLSDWTPQVHSRQAKVKKEVTNQSCPKRFISLFNSAVN